MKPKQYITQLSKSDLASILTGEDVKAGDGVKIDKNGDGIVIAINQSQFKRWVYTFLRNGGQVATDIDSVPLDHFVN